jgi:hypothetical protein
LTSKQTYEQVITDAGATIMSLHTLGSSVVETDLELSTNLITIEDNLISIVSAAQAKLDTLAQEEVINSFLAEMKVVFDKYTAKMEVGSSGVGYGMTWGGGSTSAAGIKFTAILNGVESTKEINKTIITSQDLV